MYLLSANSRVQFSIPNNTAIFTSPSNCIIFFTFFLHSCFKQFRFGNASRVVLPKSGYLEICQILKILLIFSIIKLLTHQNVFKTFLHNYRSWKSFFLHLIYFLYNRIENLQRIISFVKDNNFCIWFFIRKIKWSLDIKKADWEGTVLFLKLIFNLGVVGVP